MFRDRASWRHFLATALRLSVVVDLAIIAGFGLLFAHPILNFNEEIVPSGTPDWETNTAVFALVRHSILDHAEFPLWDPFFQSGVPYMGEPRTYLLNPIASVPSLIFGPFNGPKVAAALSIIIAGMGMYYLAGVLGVSRPLRVWSGLLFALSGSIAARVWAGHFQFIVALPYVPLAFALAVQALRRPGPIYPMLAGLAGALIFLSGHVYYTIFTAGGLIITFLVAAAAESWRDGRLQPEGGVAVLRRGLAVAAWAAGFAAIQLVPQLESRQYFHATTYDLSESETVFASAQNFFVPDVPAAGETDRVWGWWEYYAYVGVVPLLGLALVIPALRRPERRFAIAWAAVMFGWYLAWASASHTFFWPVYQRFSWLEHLRAPSRTLAFAAPFLIGLAALGLDDAIDWLRSRWRWRVSFGGRLGGVAAGVPIGLVAAVVIVAGCFYALRDVFEENQIVFVETPRYRSGDLTVDWLQERGESVVYITEPDLLLSLPVEFYDAGIKRLDASWEPRFEPARGDAAPGGVAPVIGPQSKYLIGYSEPPADAQLVGDIEDKPVYELTASPHYASTYSSADPPLDMTYAWREKTREARARIVSANVIEVVAEAATGHDRLLVFESFYPGWRLEVDGEDAGGADNYGGYLSADALPGEHTYTFVFDPRSFRYGAAVTIGTVLGAMLLLSSRGIAWLRAQRRERGGS